eukprot:4241599-Ditylum_brightwellii.AAC.1
MYEASRSSWLQDLLDGNDDMIYVKGMLTYIQSKHKTVFEEFTAQNKTFSTGHTLAVAHYLRLDNQQLENLRSLLKREC